tara:strand:+ start:2728 stop:3990 length:1263 start_codon:yes stop_codon:yes gene_type:complete
MIYSLRKQCIDVIFMLMLILSAGGLLFVFNRNIASTLFLGFLLFVLIFMEDKWKKTKVNSIFITFFILVILGSINYYFSIIAQTANKYLFHLLSVTLSSLFLFHFINNRTHQQLIRSLYVALGLIVFHSLFNAIAYFFLKDNLIIITSEYHECETFMNIFFYDTERAATSLYGLEFCRNQGLFWEPGILQIFLNIFFFLEAFIIKKRKSLLLLTAIVVLTTYSTTGLALLLIQSVVYLFNEFKTNKWLILLVFVLGIPLYMIFSLNVEDKIQGEKQASFQKRYFDLIQPLFIALENPLTGIGLDVEQFQNMRQEFYISSSSLNAIQEKTGVESKVNGTDKGSSNSITYLMAAMGFPTAIFVLYMFFKQQIIKEKKWLWMLIMVASVMSEPLLLRPFFLLFIVSGFTYVFYKITSHKQQIA